MRFILKPFCCLILSSFIGLALTAQNQPTDNKYRAEHWGLGEGLSQGETYRFIKDINGFLWVGTRWGLDRFDGNTFKVFLHQRTNNKSIISNRVINGLAEDSLHNIWIGSEDKGASRYDIRTEEFTNFSPDSTNTATYVFGATKNEVLCQEGDYIIGYNIYSLQKKVIASLKGYGLNNAFYIERTNTVWCLNGGDSKGKVTLFRVNVADNKIEAFPLPHYSTSDYLDAEAMYFDEKRNCIWINGNEGLLQFTFTDNQFHHISALKKYEEAKDYGRWVGITMDKQNRVWFATHPFGIIIYDPKDETVNFPFPRDSVLQHKTGDVNASLYCDRDNIVWSGSWLRNGVYQIAPFSPVVKFYPSSSKKDSLNGYIVVRAMDAGKGKIWVGTKGGINILDTKTNTFSVLRKKDLPGIQAPQEFICPVMIDTLEQKACVMTDAGIFNMNMVTKECTPVIFKHFNNIHLSDEGVPKIDGYKMFFSASSGDTTHVSVLTLNSDTAREILFIPHFPVNNFFTVPVNNHFLFFQGNSDEKSNSTYENKNNEWSPVHTPIDSIRWTYLLYVEEDSSYWVAGDNQLFHFDKNFNRIKTYDQSDGMPELPVAGLIKDNNGNIWFHTDRSIQELNVTTGQIKTLSESDGYERQDMELLPFADKDANGNIYYCGGVFGNGLHKATPGNFTSTVSNVYLRSLTINQKPLPLNTGINSTDTLSLKYNQTKIAIDVGIIDFYSKGKSRIRYKLEQKGTHEAWQYAPNYYTIRYESLSWGDYFLTIQASNASNEFNGPEKILFIHVTPPFWQTWWFRIIAAVFAITAIYAFMQYRSRNLREKNIVLEEKVMHRTKELKHSLEDLRSMQAQLIQSEKMASLGELTAGIAHEIQNPLNFVNNFSEVNKELVGELKTEMATGNMQTADEIADDIKDNSEKINHHGKRADAIIKNMLQHSRQTKAIKEPTDINALCDEYLRLSYHGLRARDKNFHAVFKTDFDESISKINVVPQDIGRVLLNLFNNAFYAVNQKLLVNLSPVSDNYEPLVSVQTKKLNEGIEIKVADNGVGIPLSLVDKIFQPFFTTKPTGSGTGLGLSLAYDIITKEHNGTIRVNSVENEGTELIILLPT